MNAVDEHVKQLITNLKDMEGSESQFALIQQAVEILRQHAVELEAKEGAGDQAKNFTDFERQLQSLNFQVIRKQILDEQNRQDHGRTYNAYSNAFRKIYKEVRYLTGCLKRAEASLGYPRIDSDSVEIIAQKAYVSSTRKDEFGLDVFLRVVRMMALEWRWDFQKERIEPGRRHRLSENLTH